MEKINLAKARKAAKSMDIIKNTMRHHSLKRQESWIPERLEIQRISQPQELRFLMAVKD